MSAADGSLDWMCSGRFDGPASASRILDGGRGRNLRRKAAVRRTEAAL